MPRRSRLLRPFRARRRVLPDDAGMVTAETAVVLPVLLVVLAVAVFVLACVGAQLRCVDAAHLAARAAARGDLPAEVLAVGRSVAPSGADVRVEHRGGQVLVLVTTEVLPFGSGSACAGPGQRTGRRPRRGGCAVSVPAGERGSATVLVLALSTVVVLVGAVLATLGSVGVARHRAASVADLAALAAASRALQGPGPACEAARQVATSADATLTDCRLVGAVADVTAEIRPPGRVGNFGTATARARAGPGAERPPPIGPPPTGRRRGAGTRPWPAG